MILAKKIYTKRCFSVSLLLVGLLVGLASFTCILLLPSFITNQITQRLVLKNGSTILNRWSKPNVPIYFKVWLFDVTNAQQVIDSRGTKPILKEIGPFVFRLNRSKDIISFAGDNVYYTEKKVYHFSPELSCCAINTTVTIPNIPLVAVVDKALSYNLPLVGRFIPRLINRAIQSLREQLFVRRQVNELLFEGYDVELLKMVSRVGSLVGLPQTNQKFALLKGRNDTWRPEQDGVWGINTGQRDRKMFGKVSSWNSYKQLPYWSAPTCNVINGSDGTLFAPPIKTTEPLYVFNPELCRTINLIYAGPSEVRSIDSLRYVLNPLNFAPTVASQEPLARPINFNAISSSSQPLQQPVADLQSPQQHQHQHQQQQQQLQLQQKLSQSAATSGNDNQLEQQQQPFNKQQPQAAQSAGSDQQEPVSALAQHLQPALASITKPAASLLVAAVQRRQDNLQALASSSVMPLTEHPHPHPQPHFGGFSARASGGHRAALNQPASVNPLQQMLQNGGQSSSLNQVVAQTSGQQQQQQRFVSGGNQQLTSNNNDNSMSDDGNNSSSSSNSNGNNQNNNNNNNNNNNQNNNNNNKLSQQQVDTAQKLAQAAQEAQDLKETREKMQLNPLLCFCDRRTTFLNGVNICEFDGLIDMSKCAKQTSVIFGSMPHFHLNDPRLLRQVHGLEPNSSKHTTYLDIEPNTGLVLGGKRRFQLNIMIKHNVEVEGFENIADMLVPVMWIEESALIPEESAKKFKSLYTDRIRMINIILLSAIVASVALVLIDLKYMLVQSKGLAKLFRSFAIVSSLASNKQNFSVEKATRRHSSGSGSASSPSQSLSSSQSSSHTSILTSDSMDMPQMEKSKMLLHSGTTTTTNNNHHMMLSSSINQHQYAAPNNSEQQQQQQQ